LSKETNKMAQKHTDKCTEMECYCMEPNNPDPICDVCGCAAWACDCYLYDDDDDDDDEFYEEEEYEEY